MKKVKRWAPLIVWIALIFGLSSIPGIPGKGFRLPQGSDKVIHFFEYAVLAYLLCRGLSYGRADPGISHGVASLALAAGIALTDEYYQSFIPGRDASIFDLFADLLGIITGNALYYFVKVTSWRRYRNK